MGTGQIIYGQYIQKSDICRIVHLTDMDGVFVPDDAVIEVGSIENGRPLYYTDTQI